jgi:hypothetical protein
MGHGITGPGASGPVTGWAAPLSAAQKSAGAPDPVVKVRGFTVENTSTTVALDVIIRDGGASGPILAAASVPVQTGAVPGIGDVNLCNPRVALAGLYVELDGGTAANLTIWVE